MRNADLTVQISTKLNRSHVVTGRDGADPADPRPHREGPAPAAASSGSPSRTRCARCTPPRGRWSRPARTCAPRSTSSARWRRRPSATATACRGTAFRDDYTEIRRRIARVVPGCEAYDEKVDRPGGFVLPHPPRDTRTFETEAGRAVFAVSPIDVLHVPEGRLLLQTLRSPRPVQHHDLRPRRPLPRHRGRPPGGVRAPATTSPRWVSHGDQFVDLVSEWTDGSERSAPRLPGRPLRPAAGLRRGVLPGDQPAGPARLDGAGSNCPTSKSVIVRLEPARDGHGGSDRAPAGSAARTRATSRVRSRHT